MLIQNILYNIYKSTNYKPPCRGKQHFLIVKLSEPDMSTKLLRLSMSSFTLENARS